MNREWTDKHQKNYAKSDWIDKPSLFAEVAITYFPKSGGLLELGAGQGQDSRFFAEHGYEVISTDLEQSALELSKAKLFPELARHVTLKQVDMRETLPFADESYVVVYAHLAIHYFNEEGTRRLVSEVRRVLKPGGVFAFLVNSTSDPEYGAGEKIEQDYFRTNDMLKRYFSVQSTAKFMKGFETKLLDGEGESYKDNAKGVHGLIRFIGIKPVE